MLINTDRFEELTVSLPIHTQRQHQRALYGFAWITSCLRSACSKFNWRKI